MHIFTIKKRFLSIQNITQYQYQIDPSSCGHTLSREHLDEKVLGIGAGEVG
jgi:hypothetical protein